MELSEQAKAKLDFYYEKDFQALFREPAVLEGMVERMRQQQEKHEPYVLPEGIAELVHVEEMTAEDGTQIFVMSPLEDAPSDVTVVYFHGGGFLMDAEIQHFKFCANLIERLNCTVMLPIYPMIPTATCDDAIASALASYEAAKKRYPNNRIVLMGDSAGASLSIAVAQLCAQRGAEQPKLIIGSSPYIDITGTVERASGVHVENDPMLHWYGSTEIAKMYCGDHDLLAFPPDPFFGPKEGLPPMLLFAGTREVLLAGIKEFAKQVEEAGGTVDFRPYEGMWHTFLLSAKTGIPECDKGFEEAAVAIENC